MHLSILQWPKVLNTSLEEVDPELNDIIEHEKNRQVRLRMFDSVVLRSKRGCAMPWEGPDAGNLDSIIEVGSPSHGGHSSAVPWAWDCLRPLLAPLLRHAKIAALGPAAAHCSGARRF